MKIEKLSLEQGLRQGSLLSFVYIREISRVVIGKTPQEIRLPEVLEVRFFQPDTEIRIFPGESGLQAVKLSREEGDTFISKERMLANPQRFGKLIRFREYLTPDGDGQMCIDQVCLTEWEGGEANAQ